MTRADALRPMHRSVLETQQRARGYRPRPVNMSAVALTSEQREFIERIAIGIFTDMTNSGATLQETLAAVYLSGSENEHCGREGFLGQVDLGHDLLLVCGRSGSAGPVGRGRGARVVSPEVPCPHM